MGVRWCGVWCILAGRLSVGWIPGYASLVPTLRRNSDHRPLIPDLHLGEICRDHGAMWTVMMYGARALEMSTELREIPQYPEKDPRPEKAPSPVPEKAPT